MIKSIEDKEAERISRREASRRLPSGIRPTGLRKPRMLHHAMDLTDPRVPPANRLEKPSGDRAGSCSVRINERWRICFRREGSAARDLSRP